MIQWICSFKYYAYQPFQEFAKQSGAVLTPDAMCHDNHVHVLTDGKYDGYFRVYEKGEFCLIADRPKEPRQKSKHKVPWRWLPAARKVRPIPSKV